MGLRRSLSLTLFCIILNGVVHCSDKVGLYGVYMTPYGNDAKDMSRHGWGIGGHGVFPIRPWHSMAAGVVGFDVVNLMSKTESYQDPNTHIKMDQETSQSYFRFYLGAEFGPHGNGFLQPHAGINLAAVIYGISTELVIPGDYGQEDFRKSLNSTTKAVFGYDFTLGLELNFSNSFAVDGGVRYLKSFSVPVQLGEGSETIHPQYFQAYLGVGLLFDAFGSDDK